MFHPTKQNTFPLEFHQNKTVSITSPCSTDTFFPLYIDHPNNRIHSFFAYKTSKKNLLRYFDFVAFFTKLFDKTLRFWSRSVHLFPKMWKKYFKNSKKNLQITGWKEKIEENIEKCVRVTPFSVIKQYRYMNVYLSFVSLSFSPFRNR